MTLPGCCPSVRPGPVCNHRARQSFRAPSLTPPSLAASPRVHSSSLVPRAQRVACPSHATPYPGAALPCGPHDGSRVVDSSGRAVVCAPVIPPWCASPCAEPGSNKPHKRDVSQELPARLSALMTASRSSTPAVMQAVSRRAAAACALHGSSIRRPMVCQGSRAPSTRARARPGSGGQGVVSAWCCWACFWARCWSRLTQLCTSIIGVSWLCMSG